MKRFLTLLAFVALAITANADVIQSGACGAQGDNVTYVLNGDGTLVISGSGEMKNYSYGEVPWDKNRSKIIKVQIEDGVTSIGYNAFRYYSGLTTVTIGNSVTSIGYSAFDGCTGLTSVTIPNSVTSIGENVFESCSSLSSVSIGNSVLSIGNSAFYNCSALTSVTIPNSVTSIGDYAFSGCSRLTSVSIGNSVTSIGNSAFYNCSRLSSLTIPKSVTNIGSSAFSYCYGIKEIHCQAITPPTASYNTFTGTSTNYCKLYVPMGTREDYSFSMGWNVFVNIIEEAAVSDGECAAPTIEYVDGHLKFSSTTPNATYSYTITDDDIKTTLTKSTTGDLPLSTTYNITVYAEAKGYGTSNATTKTIKFGTSGEDIDALKAQIRSLQAQNEALESENTNLVSENSSLKEDVKELTSENTTLKTENESLTKENSTLESKNNDLAAEVSDLKDDVKTLESENSSLNETIKKYAEGDLNLDGRTNIDDVVYLLKLDSYSSDTDALALLLDGSTAITLSEITDKYGDVEFYTLNGVKVNIPNQTGIYIVKKNGETKMVVVKK